MKITLEGVTIDEMIRIFEHLRDMESARNSEPCPAANIVDSLIPAPVEPEPYRESTVFERPTQSPIPAPSVNSTQIELDAKGMPWDERIHSSSKAKVQDGTWKLRRGVDKEVVEEVKSEYSGGIPSPSVEVPEQVQDTIPLEVPPAPPSEGIPKVITREQIVVRITSALGKGELVPSQVKQVLAQFGVADMQDLVNHPDKYDAIFNALGGGDGTR